MKYICHGLGLGDHILCNGLIRKYHSIHPDEYCLVVKPNNRKNVERMFDDCDWLSFHDSTTFSPENFSKNEVISISYKMCDITFDEYAYISVGLDFEERWKSFYIQRNHGNECALENFLNVPDRFVLIHNKGSAIPPANLKIDSPLPRVYVNPNPCEDSIFDWMGLIEKAEEIHCINSSFVHLVESMDISCGLFFHNVYQNDYPFRKKKNWLEVYP